jgi:hypothetical protein
VRAMRGALGNSRKVSVSTARTVRIANAANWSGIGSAYDISCF